MPHIRNIVNACFVILGTFSTPAFAGKLYVSVPDCNAAPADTSPRGDVAYKDENAPPSVNITLPLEGHIPALDRPSRNRYLDARESTVPLGEVHLNADGSASVTTLGDGQQTSLPCR